MGIEIVQFAQAISSVIESWRAIYEVDDYTPITILEAYGFNDGATTLYWQIHAGHSPPPTGFTSLHTIRVNAGQSFYWNPIGGFRVSAAGVWVASTTPVVYTAAPTPAFWVMAKYLPMHNVLVDPT